MNIRKARETDAEALIAIYAPYVLHTAITFEYEVPTADEFRQRIKNTLKKYPYLVAEENGEILGYAYAGTFKGRAAYDRAAETSIYVKQDNKQAGVGSALYAALEDEMRRMGILNAYACIACTKKEDEHLTNGSVRFHEKKGYKLIGTFSECGFKFNRWYDMVWMEKFLGEHTENPPAVVWYEQLK